MNNYNVLNDFPSDKYNVLIPVQSIQDINPIYKYVQNQVRISTNLQDKEIYAEGSAGSNMYALTHKGLMKLCNAANGQIVESSKLQPRVCDKCIEIAKATRQAPKCISCNAIYNTAYHVTMKFPELSGGWKIVQASREIDLSVVARSGQADKLKEFATEHAESKAMSRCIRKALNIKNAYTLEELKKPFVVIYPVLDAKDPEVKKALIAGSMAASNLLYGSGMQLQPKEKLEALPSAVEHNEYIEEDYEVEIMDKEASTNNEPLGNDINNNGYIYFCSVNSCGAEIQANVAAYSQGKYGRPLCFKCQQAEKRKGGLE